MTYENNEKVIHIATDKVVIYKESVTPWVLFPDGSFCYIQDMSEIRKLSKLEKTL